MRQSFKREGNNLQTFVNVKPRRKALQSILKGFSIKELLNDDMKLIPFALFAKAPVIADNIGVVDPRKLLRPTFEPAPLLPPSVITNWHDLQRDNLSLLDCNVRILDLAYCLANYALPRFLVNLLKDPEAAK